MSEPERTPEEDELAGFPGAQDRLFALSSSAGGTASSFEKRQAWYYYVNGYKDAADLLVAHIAEGDIRKLGFSIAFLYRQHLELALKSLIRESRRVLGWQEEFPKTHRIDELWRLCVALLKEISPASVENDEIKHTTRLIAEFCAVDPTSEAFRYPENRSGVLLQLDVQIILAEMKEVVGKISLLLECIDTHVSTQDDDAF